MPCNLPLFEKCIVNEELKAVTTETPTRKEEEVKPSLVKLRVLQHFILCSAIMILFKQSGAHFHSFFFSQMSHYSFLSTGLNSDRVMRGKYLIYLFIY